MSDLPRRKWYPSGPWIDGIRPPEPTSGTNDRSEPDPSNYKVTKAEQVGDFLVLQIHYPDCKNFEGNKILVFKGVTALDLLKQKFIDPHFVQRKDVVSPIARFIPTEEGWKMAIDFSSSACRTAEAGQPSG